MDTPRKPISPIIFAFMFDNSTLTDYNILKR